MIRNNLFPVLILLEFSVLFIAGCGSDDIEINFAVVNWNAEFTISGPTDMLKYNFSNAATGSSGSYFYGGYYLAPMTSLDVDMSKGVRIPLDPIKQNRITFTASVMDDSGNTRVVYELDTLLTPESWVVEVGRTKLMVEDGRFIAQAYSTAFEIETVRQLLPDDPVQLGIFRTYNQNDSLDIMTRLGMSYGGDSVIYGTVGVLEDPLLGLTKPFHEMAHAYFNRAVSKKDMATLINLYLKAMATTGYRAYPSFALFGPPDDIENESIFSLFDESSYITEKASHGNYGHPYSNEGEMFASTSTVLRYFSKDFTGKLTALKNRDPKLGELAEKIAFTVRQTYGNNASSIFPANM